MTHRSLRCAVRVLSAAVLVFALAACRDTPDSSATDPATQATDAGTQAPVTGTPAPTEATTAGTDPDSVTLIGAGEEPRTQLRYDLTDGQAINATVRQTQAVTQAIDGQSAGEISVTSLFDFDGTVDTDGDTLTLRYTIENARVTDDTDPAIAQAVSQSISAMNGATVVTTMDTRGQIVDNTFELTDRLAQDPFTVSMIESLEQSTLSAPLPDEPVGVGARWSSVQEVQAQGITITQTTETELRSVNGTVVDLAFTAVQEAPGGPSTLDSGESEGAVVEIEVWDVTSEGTSQLDLTSPIPTSVGRTRGHQEMAVTAGGQSARLEQDISGELELTPN